jgi:hypothetical protein
MMRTQITRSSMVCSHGSRGWEGFCDTVQQLVLIDMAMMWSDTPTRVARHIMRQMKPSMPQREKSK